MLEAETQSKLDYPPYEHVQLSIFTKNAPVSYELFHYFGGSGIENSGSAQITYRRYDVGILVYWDKRCHYKKHVIGIPKPSLTLSFPVPNKVKARIPPTSGKNNPCHRKGGKEASDSRPSTNSLLRDLVELVRIDEHDVSCWEK
jgi:hypothetical protein